MKQQELFQPVNQEKTNERKYSDSGLYRGAFIPLNSGVGSKQLYDIAKRSYDKNEISQADYDAAIEAIKKAERDIKCVK